MHCQRKHFPWELVWLKPLSGGYCAGLSLVAAHAKSQLRKRYSPHKLMAADTAIHKSPISLFFPFMAAPCAVSRIVESQRAGRAGLAQIAGFDSSQRIAVTDCYPGNFSAKLAV
jgi:hypothetical protein